MSDHELATLLRDHVDREEPPFLMSPDTSIALGRRTLVRRRTRRGFAGVLVAAAAVAAVPLLPWGGGPGSDRDRIDPATTAALADYDPQQMPELIDRRVRAEVGAGLAGLGDADFTAGDSQGSPLPPRYWDKASSMDVAYGGTGDRRVRVSLTHSRGEAEGDAARNCRNDVAEGYAFSCEVTTAPNGDIVTTRVMAVRPLERFDDGGWGALTREELRTGQPAPGDPSRRRIDPATVYFIRSVESVHSETFLTTASETVHAPDLATATRLWEVPPAALAQVVTDPELVIPAPPVGSNGCPWTLPSSNVTCSRDPG